MTGNYPRIANFDFYITKAFSYLDLTALTFWYKSKSDHSLDITH